MEGNYLVKEPAGPPTTNAKYGTVNPCCDVEKGSTGADECDSTKKHTGNRPKSCSCLLQQGGCDCSINKKTIRFEPWSRHKSVVMSVGLITLCVWIVAISIIGTQGKL